MTSEDITTALDADRYQTYNGWDISTVCFGDVTQAHYFSRGRGTAASPATMLVNDVLHEWSFIAQNAPAGANFSLIMKPTIFENSGGNLWGGLDFQGADFGTWLSLRRTGIRAGSASTYTTFANARPAAASFWQHNSNGTGQYVLASAIVVTAANTDLAYSTDYVFSGTTATWTLPAINGTSGRAVSIKVKNRGSGNLIVNTNAAANVLYNISLTNTVVITPGQAFEFLPDGTYFNLI